ncbi:hypothetical protein C5167_044189, partial [Papaver somniferum]
IKTLSSFIGKPLNLRTYNAIGLRTENGAWRLITVAGQVKWLRTLVCLHLFMMAMFMSPS